jgi:hypothetical protein
VIFKQQVSAGAILMGSKNLIITLTRFQIHSAVRAIIDLSMTQKAVFLGLVVFFYNVLDPVGYVRAFLSLSLENQAVILSSVFSLYLVLSNIFNRKLIISQQNSYLRQLPIESRDFLWAHVVTLTIMNMLFAGTYAFLLIRAIIEINISWISSALLFIGGTIGMSMGQVHYAISSLRGIRRKALSLGIFWIIIFSGWYVFSRTNNMGALIYKFFSYIYISVCIVLGYQRTRSILARYMDTDFSLEVDMVNTNLLDNRSSIWGMVIIDYLSLLRNHKRELVIRILLSVFFILISIFGIMINDGLSITGVTAFALFGSSVACLLLGTLVITSQLSIAKDEWIRNVLPLNAIEREIAEYLSLIVISFPISVFYFSAGQMVFGLEFHNNLIMICHILLLTTLLVLMTKLLINIRLDKIKVVLIQVHVFPIFIVIATFDMLVFFIMLLLMHVI